MKHTVALRPHSQIDALWLTRWQLIEVGHLQNWVDVRIQRASLGCLAAVSIALLRVLVSVFDWSRPQPETPELWITLPSGFAVSAT